MHQNPISAAWRSPIPLAGFKGPSGRERMGRDGGGRKGKEGRECCGVQ